MNLEPDYSRLPHPRVDLISDADWAKLQKHRNGTPEQQVIAALDTDHPGWHLPTIEHLHWAHLARETHMFRDANGRWPKDDKGELSFTRVLGEWLEQQKAIDPETATPRDQSRLDYLDRLWIISKEPGLGHAWLDSAREAAALIARDGKIPSESSDDPRRARVAKWIARQRSASRDSLSGLWTPEREMTLDKLIPNWRGADNRIQSPQFKAGSDTPRSWLAQYEKLRRFVEVHGRAPAEIDSSEDAKDLIPWLRGQRRAKRTRSASWTQAMENLLTELLPEWSAAIVDLSKLPVGVDIDPDRAEGLTQGWVNSAERARAFIVQHERWPQASSDDADERSIRRWIDTQRRVRAIADGRTTEARLRYLETRIPSWEAIDTGLGIQWVRQAERLKEFVQKYLEFPRVDSLSHTERTLSAWLARQRTASRGHSGGAWSQIRQDHLDDVAPGWFTGRLALTKSELTETRSFKEWLHRAEELRFFVALHGIFPSKTGGRPGDRSLAKWLRQQRKARKENERWTDEKESALDELVPGWRTRRLGT